jgi:hypothetical protein
MVAPQIFSEWLDGSSARLREILGELEGASPEILERIDRFSRPSGDGPPPHNRDATILYERLVLLALAEATAAAQKEPTQMKRAGASEAKGK